MLFVLFIECSSVLASAHTYAFVIASSTVHENVKMNINLKANAKQVLCWMREWGACAHLIIWIELWQNGDHLSKSCCEQSINPFVCLFICLYLFIYAQFYLGECMELISFHFFFCFVRETNFIVCSLTFCWNL